MNEYGMVVLVALLSITLLTGIRIGENDRFEKGREIGRQEGRFQERNEMNKAMAQMRVNADRINGFEACKIYEPNEKRA